MPCDDVLWNNTCGTMSHILRKINSLIMGTNVHIRCRASEKRGQVTIRNTLLSRHSLWIVIIIWSLWIMVIFNFTQLWSLYSWKQCVTILCPKKNLWYNDNKKKNAFQTHAVQEILEM